MRRKTIPILTDNGYENRDVLPPLRKETEQLVQTAFVELWEMDFRKLGGELYRFCNQPNELGQNVVWQGYEYQCYPVQAEGFETTTQGASNRPTLTISNMLGLITSAAENFNQMVGVSVTRRQTYEKFLDAVNFANGNPNADPNQEFVSKYVIERLTSMTAEVATLELAAPAEVEGAVFPARMMMANTCPWSYRGGPTGSESGCPYRGRPVADRFDMPTNDKTKDECSRSLLGCQARFGATAVLPFGGFLSIDKVG